MPTLARKNAGHTLPRFGRPGSSNSSGRFARLTPSTPSLPSSLHLHRPAAKKKSLPARVAGSVTSAVKRVPRKAFLAIGGIVAAGTAAKKLRSRGGSDEAPTQAPPTA